MITTLLAIIAIVIPIMAWLLLHFIKKATVAETNNEGLKTVNKVQDKQLDIAASAAESPDVLLERMRNNGL